MEPENRPYVDADTDPGDAGTEAWADNLTGSGDPVETTDDGAAVEGSPADAFINDADAIETRSDEGDPA